MDITDYEILVTKLAPPIGIYKYSATIQFVCYNKNGREKITPNLGECHGETENDARRKMDEKYRNWVAHLG